MKPKILPTQKRLSELFSYNKSTGLLKRRVKVKRTNVGDIVGIKTKSGYLAVSVDNSKFYVHRVIWGLLYGQIPEKKYVDHKNRNRKDNRLSNLRLVSEIDNNRNQKKSIKNTSGATGVFFSNRRKKWSAQIGVERKRINLGYFKSKKEAIDIRLLEERKYNFYKTHGK